MRYQLLSLLFILHMLPVGAFSLPGSSTPPPTSSTTIDGFFTDADIPLLDDSALTDFNVTSDATPSLEPEEDHDNPTTLSKRRVRVAYTKYSITIDGRNRQNWEPFRVSGYMLVTQGIPSPGTKNGQNPYDVLIYIGKPIANPRSGSLHYTTNRGLYSVLYAKYGYALLDYAVVTVDKKGTVRVVVDTRIAPANEQSYFNARSGLLANVWLVVSGGLQFVVNAKGVLTGTINFKGRGYIEPGNGRVPYVGIITGQAIGRGTLNL